jgi:hypothetical protein
MHALSIFREEEDATSSYVIFSGANSSYNFNLPPDI